MSDQIPFEIQVEIIKRLPVKSLVRFGSVSKTWKSLIGSSDFVACYSTRTQHHMFVRYNYPGYQERFVLIVDDETFPLNIVSLNPPRCFSVGHYYCIVGCSHGLLCYYVKSKDLSMTAVIWNPSIRRAFDIAVPKVDNFRFHVSVLGFGVCRETNDPKIVKINYNNAHWSSGLEAINSIPCQVDVFTFSTQAWRSLHNNLPRNLVRFHYNHNTYSVEVDGVIYWLATDYSRVDDGLIISFDVTSEEFGEIDLRNRLSRTPHCLTMSKLRESLVVLENAQKDNGLVCNVWVMESGVPKSFTKLFTFDIFTQVEVEEVIVMGFTQRGDPIIQLIKDHDDESAQLVVYERHLRKIDDIVGFDGVGHRFSVHPYMETLFLHDQPNLTQAV